jgi:hypothetical protein
MEILELAAILVQGGLPIAAIVVCIVLWRENTRVQARFEVMLDNLVEREVLDAQAANDIRLEIRRERAEQRSNNTRKGVENEQRIP